MYFMNDDLIDVLVFEREYEIRHRMRPYGIAAAEPHPLWSQLRAAVSRFFAPARARRPDPATAEEIPAASDRPAALTVIRVPERVHADALDRAA
ncbi:MAG: hypothetical protein QM589_11455 [Thermomicrobiales bacterium]